jgi:hypothetical protein
VLGNGKSHLLSSWLHNENDMESNEKKLKPVKVQYKKIPTFHSYLQVVPHF